MYNARSKILKKDEDKTEQEEEIAKLLYDYEMQLKEDSAIKKDIVKILISSVEEFNVHERNGHQSKAMLIKIPYKSLKSFRVIRNNIVNHLEKKLNCQVYFVAVRQILSKKVKTPGVKKRPISRTLTHVYNCILEDIALPSSIVGKQVRVHTDGSQTTKILLDPLDKEKVEDRLDTMSEAYKKATGKKVRFFFAKPTKFQKAMAEFKKKQKQ
mmetsp:Transcript_11547/g.13122  ORF Transcript_11547/g.13122 Transcript_11547/m.13122 type:complete len:212 (-) Transcript_11547:42-677(-)